MFACPYLKVCALSFVYVCTFVCSCILCARAQCVAAYCRVLQLVAVCRSVSQCVAAPGMEGSRSKMARVNNCVLPCVAVCCSVLQCVAVCRNVLQHQGGKDHGQRWLESTTVCSPAPVYAHPVLILAASFVL